MGALCRGNPVQRPWDGNEFEGQETDTGDNAGGR